MKRSRAFRASVIGAFALSTATLLSGCGSSNNVPPLPDTGGTGSGGKRTGGDSSSGGSAVGGNQTTTGGTSTGGTSTGGTNTLTGGVSTGGTNTLTGGTRTGGAPPGTGGTSTGGVNTLTGGTRTGGAATGGTATGGVPVGGYPPNSGGRTGGTSTGGTATGGTNTLTGGTRTGGASTGGAATGGTATGGTATGGSGNCTRPANVLSDFESGKGDVYAVVNGITNGMWYTYKDTSCGTLLPTPDAAKTAPVAAASLTGDSRYSSCNQYAMHSSLATCQKYGGVGAALKPTLGGDIRGTVDVSAYDGLTFWAKAGSGTQGPLYLELVSDKCVPATAGGNPVANNTAIDLYNCHGKLFPAGKFTSTWQQFYVPFGTSGPRWFPTAGASSSGGSCQSGQFCELPPLETNKFQSLQFAFEDPYNTSGGTYQGYDVWIDDVALYKFADTNNAGLATWTQTGNNKFPADKSYSGCTKPPAATGKLLQDAYVAWKAKFVVADGGNQRVLSPEIDGPNSNVTVSEGIGYGMLMAVYMADKALFDGLLGYWRAHASAQSMLMNWKYNGGSASGTGSATDADEDVAFALQMARKQWGASYDSDASTILAQILANDVTADNYLKPGNSFGGKDETNPSYFAPAFYKYFATVDTASGAAARWTSLAANCYTQLNNISGSNGLVPAWCTSNCTNRGDNGKYTDDTRYQYDSHRTPWRIGLDRCWNSSSDAQTYLNKVVGFFANASSSAGLSSIADVYEGSGSIATGASALAYNSMSLLGCAGAGAMGSSASGAASFRDRVWLYLLAGLYTDNPTFKAGTSSIKPGYTYYNATVGLITAMTMSGNFYIMQ